MKLILKEQPLTDRKYFFVLFGPPGVGKTTLSFTMPGPVLHLDFDRGIHRADQLYRPDYYQINEYDPDYIYGNEFKKTLSNYNSVVLDTVGTLLDDFVSRYVMASNPKFKTMMGLSLSGWGAMKSEFARFYGYLKSLGLDVCAVCHAKPYSDNSPADLAISGGSIDLVYRTADMIGYLSQSDRNTRTIDFDHSAMHIGKNMARIQAQPVPDVLSDSYDGFLASVVDECNLKLHEQTEKQKLAAETLDAFRKSILKAKGAAEINDLSTDIRTHPKYIQIQLRDAMKARVEKLGLIFDKESKLFIDA